jgi:hypothetical protein
MGVRLTAISIELQKCPHGLGEAREGQHRALGK